MTDWSTPQEAPPPLLHTWSRYSGIYEARAMAGALAAASTSWNTANQARFVPMSLPWGYPVRQAFWVNGSTVTSTNNDFAVYTMDGVRLFSTGSTAQSGTNAPQFVDVADFWLPPGDYYFALNIDSNAINRIFGNALTAENQSLAGIKQQALGSVALPAAASFAAPSAVGVGIFGVTWSETGF